MATITKPNTFSAGATIFASAHNENFDTIYNDYNGNITNANVAAGASITDTKLAQITTAAKVSGASLTVLGNVPTGAGRVPSLNAGMPIGAMVAWGKATAPTGWLLCQGQAVSRTTYSVLFDEIGTTFGTGDGSTTFNVPPQGRYYFATASSGTGSTLGGTFGAIDHAHTGPSHTHTGTTDTSGTTPNVGGGAGASSAWNHTHPFTSAAGGTGNTGTENPPSVAVHYIIFSGVA